LTWIFAQVSSHTASAAVQLAVARLGKGKAALAVELIGYNEYQGAVMKDVLSEGCDVDGTAMWCR